MVIIGICGKKGAGKSTFASMLLEACAEQGLSANCESFADPLKRGAAAIFGVPVESFEDGEFKKTVDVSAGVTYRYILQTLGTEWGRDTINKNLWINLMNNQIDTALKQEVDVFIIPDVRFDNEVQVVKNDPWCPGYIVEIVDKNPQQELDTHVSEAMPSAIIDFAVEVDKSKPDSMAQMRLRAADIIQIVGV